MQSICWTGTHCDEVPNIEGLDIALAAKVDIIAHALERTDGQTQVHVDRMLQARIGLIPTLNLFKEHGNLPAILKMVGDYSRSSGEILFGTDVGNLPGYDPTDEYRLMMRADQVLLNADPAVDVGAFAAVRYTMRMGKNIYRAE